MAPVSAGGGEMAERGPLGDLQPVLLGLLGDLSAVGVLQRLADAARALVGASEARVMLTAPGWPPSAVVSPPGRAAEQEDDDDPPSPALLSVPIRAHGADLGGLSLAAKGEGAYTKEDEQLLAGLAEAAGPAVWNARLYEESQGRQRWLEATLGVTADLVSGQTLRPGRELDLLAARALLASQSVLALVAVPQGESFRVAAASGTVPSQKLVRAVAVRFHQPTGHAQDGDAAVWLGPDAAEGLGPVLAARLGSSSVPGSVLVLARGKGAAYTRSDVSAAAVFGANAGLALDLRSRAEGNDAVLADRRRIAEAVQDLIIPRLMAAGLTLQSLGPLTPAEKAAPLIGEISRQLDTAVQSLVQTVGVLGAGQDLRRAHGSHGAAFSGALLAAAQTVTSDADTAVQITIEGHTESIPVDAERRLIDLAAEVLDVVSDGHHTGTRVSLTVTAGEHEAELVVQDQTRGDQTRGDHDPRSSALARELTDLASRISGSTLSAASGARLTCRVPFAQHSSPA